MGSGDVGVGFGVWGCGELGGGELGGGELGGGELGGGEYCELGTGFGLGLREGENELVEMKGEGEGSGENDDDEILMCDDKDDDNIDDDVEDGLRDENVVGGGAIGESMGEYVRDDGNKVGADNNDMVLEEGKMSGEELDRTTDVDVLLSKVV
jgi:hypothetical protein